MKTGIAWIPGLSKGSLGISARPRGGDWLQGEVKAWRASGVYRVVSALTPSEEAELDLANERTACRLSGLQFTSLPIPDRGVPPSPAAFRAVVEALCADLEAGQTVLVHCRQGIGRASMVAAAVLVEMGARPDAAFAKIGQARGRPVPDTEEQREWMQRLAAGISSAPRTRRVCRRALDAEVHA